jgi:glycosyltransferase involved in cell wall biosynthesis
MKILFVLEHFHPYIGGVEYLFYYLGKSLVAENIEISIVTTRFDNDLPEYEEIEGMKIHRVNCKNRFLFLILSLPKLFRLSKNVDIIHTSTYTAAFPAFLTGLLRRKKTIITFHEYWGTLWNKLPYLSFYERNAFRFFEYFISRLPFNTITAVSDATKHSLINSGISEKKITRIYNGLNYEEIDALKTDILNSHTTPKDSNQFIFVGRLGVSKGIDILIPAVDRALSEFEDITFKMVIPKVPQKIYQKITYLVNNMENQSRVFLTHNLTKRELYKEILLSNFLLIPSYSEGFCFIAAETQALGTPIISSHNTALIEVVGSKNIKLKNLNSQALYNAIAKGIHNQWDQDKTTKFTLSDSIANYIELYKEILKTNQ